MAGCFYDFHNLLLRHIVICKLCNSESLEPSDRDVKDFEYGSPGHYDYLKCTQCGLLNITPLPDSDILALTYPDTYHAYHSHHCASMFAGGVSDGVFAGADLLISFSCSATDKTDVIV